MKIRCDYPSHAFYHAYGGVGISYCVRWRVFSNFLEDMGERPEGMTLDRIDSEDHYYKENCRWATRTEQARSRNNTKLTMDIARDIRRIYAEGKLNQREIGVMFGIKTRHVSLVITGKCWNE